MKWGLISFIFCLQLQFFIQCKSNLDQNQKFDKDNDSSYQLQHNSKILYINNTKKGLDIAKKYFNMNWPWKRQHYGLLSEYLKLRNAKLLVFDSVFWGKSPYKPKLMRDKKGYLQIIEGDDDKITAQYFKENNVLIGYVFSMGLKELNISSKRKATEFYSKYKKRGVNFFKNFFKEKNIIIPDNPSRKDIITLLEKYLEKKFRNKYKKEKINLNYDFKSKSLYVNDLSKGLIPRYLNFKMSYHDYNEVSKYFASTNLIMDKDGIIRSQPLLIQFHKWYFPSLSFASYLEYINFDKNKEVITVKDQSIVVRDAIIPLNNNGTFKLIFKGKQYEYYDNLSMIYFLTLIDKCKSLLFYHNNRLLSRNLKLKDLYNDLTLYQNTLKNLANKELQKKLSLTKEELKLFYADFQNKVILIGSELEIDAASNNGDIWESPIDDKTYGVHFHGTAIDNLIQKDYAK